MRTGREYGSLEEIEDHQWIKEPQERDKEKGRGVE
jgi:hypothetical protein